MQEKKLPPDVLVYGRHFRDVRVDVSGKWLVACTFERCDLWGAPLAAWKCVFTSGNGYGFLGGECLSFSNTAGNKAVPAFPPADVLAAIADSRPSRVVAENPMGVPLPYSLTAAQQPGEAFHGVGVKMEPLEVKITTGQYRHTCAVCGRDNFEWEGDTCWIKAGFVLRRDPETGEQSLAKCGHCGETQPDEPVVVG